MSEKKENAGKDLSIVKTYQPPNCDLICYCNTKLVINQLQPHQEYFPGKDSSDIDMSLHVLCHKMEKICRTKHVCQMLFTLKCGIFT